MKIKRILCILLLAILLIPISACKKENANVTQIRELIGELQYSCNNLDVDTLLGCINPDISDPIRLGLAVYRNQNGTTNEELINEIFYSINDTDDEQIQENPSEFLKTLNIDVRDIQVQDDEALVTTECTFTIYDEDFDREIDFYCIKELDKWYVDDFQL